MHENSKTPAFVVGLDEPGAPWRITALAPWEARAVTKSSLLEVLTSAISHGMNVPTILNAYAIEHRGLTRAEISSFSSQLEAGVALPTAMEQFPALFHPAQVVAVRYGFHTQTVPDVLSLLLRQESANMEAENRHKTFSWSYGFCLTVVFFVIYAGINFFIVPTMKKMFDEFGLNLPWLFRLQIYVAKTFWNYWPVILLLFVLVWTWILSSRFSALLRRGVPAIVRSDLSRKSAAVLYDLFAISVDRGVPMVSTLSVIAKYHPDASIRNKLLWTRNDIELGTPPWHAMHLSGLIDRNEWSALETSTSSAQSYLLRNISDRLRDRGDKMLVLLTSLISPLFTLILGAGVALIVISIYSVLVTLISALT